ncbi:hypothetical protein [Acetatifactor muris]|uniref:hypothetical protein n=1 Tax=Acetatifactor muris TaxID=879566 RepID=UPI0023F25ECE|nr:hypothetical protein [Acetatifactor muris]
MVEIENLKKEILDLIFEELNETLTDEQQELLERYSVANNITVALTERLAYQQGMRDFLNLFISLLKG